MALRRDLASATSLSGARHGALGEEDQWTIC